MNLKLRIIIVLILSLSIFVGLPKAAEAAATFDTYVNALPATVPITSVNQPVVNKLIQEINNMLVDQDNNGIYDHLAPASFVNGGNLGTPPTHVLLYFNTPAELISTLSMAYPYLPAALQTKVKSYLDSEMLVYPPLTTGYFPPFAGTLGQQPGVRREPFPVDPNHPVNIYPPPPVSIEIAYPIWQYTYYTGDQRFITNAGSWNSLVNIYNSFRATNNVSIYTEVAGLTGFARLAKLKGDTALANTVTSYVSGVMSSTPFSTFSANADAKMRVNRETSPVFMNGSGGGCCGANMRGLFSREVGQYLRDNELPAAQAYSQRIERNNPLWYLTLPGWGFDANSGFVGNGENLYAPPELGWTDFMIHAYILGENFQTLNSYLDFPSRLGDLFYIQDLIATIEAPSGSQSTTCTLNPGTWTSTSTVQGTSATLNITGNGSTCAGQQVNLNITKNGFFGILGAVQNQPNPSSVTLSSNGTATATWTAEYTFDPGSVLGAPNQYFFNATLHGGSSVASSLLNVSQAPSGGPAQTPTPAPSGPTPTRAPSAAPTNVPTQIPTRIPPSPTPIPPTPTPVPQCNIVSAAWATATANEGDVVTLTVTGNGNCAGRPVKFDAFESDIIFGLIPIDHPANKNPTGAVFNGNTATSYWSAEWLNACLGLCNPPKYYFNALTYNSPGTIVKARSSNPLLSVNKGSFSITGSGPTAQTNSSSAVITWDTASPSTTRVDYGLINQYIGSSPVPPDNTLVTAHSVTISNLRACTQYRYRILSVDSAGNSVARGDIFDTTGCPGGSTIQSIVSALVSNTSQGLLSLLGTSTSKGITLDIPNQYNNNPAYFQIKQLDGSKVITAEPAPLGQNSIGTNIYRLDAMTNNTNSVASFSGPIKVTLDYQDADIAGIDPATLNIKRFNTAINQWEDLSNCGIDSTAHTVTCETSHFSDFGLFGVTRKESGVSDKALAAFIISISFLLLVANLPSTSNHRRKKRAEK